MTIQEWNKNPDNANRLREILNDPTMRAAISILEGKLLCNTLGTSNALIQFAGQADVLFGHDSGRAAFLADLRDLAEVAEDIQPITPTYQ